MKLICIDGIDKSGKSTIITRIFEETNGTVMILDRGISTWHFFNMLLERYDVNSTYMKDYNAKLKDFRKSIDLAVILKVNKLDWQIRCHTNNEPKLVGNLSFKDHQDELTRWFNKAHYQNVLQLNTSELSEDECIDAIMKRLKLKRK